MIPLLELLAILSTASYGVLLARRQQMDFIGVFSIALIVAFGGGTLRDLLLDRHPIFWVGQWHYPVIVFAVAIVTSLFRKIPAKVEKYLHVPDALGLGFYSILGAGFALEEGTSWFVAALLGVVTGIFGGIFGDVICNRIPSVFRPATRLYATCSFVGCWVFLLLRKVEPLPESVALWSGVVVIVALRLLALKRDWRLPGHEPPVE
ncbi:MAG: trimeric intracellular cation channel family protein [Verrucomicrobiales bacterium]|nr:trimeric intracellular cation channel family protein [Verrucomicrobiales bacterium]